MDTIEIVKWVSIAGFFALAIGVIRSILSKEEEEQTQTNYKNIAQMAKNLVNCKVSTRKQVLTDLYTDPDWTEAEVDELKNVLEGILHTKLYIDKPGEEKSKGLKTV